MGDDMEDVEVDTTDVIATPLTADMNDLVGDLVDEKDRFKLQQDPGTQKWWLTDTKTSITIGIMAPPMDEVWLLDVTEEGQAFLESESESHWVCRRFFMFK